MNSFKKIILISSFFVLFNGFIFSEELPHGYKNISLGMSLEETKDNLVKDPDFGYHGDRDVSLIPNSSKTLIETDAE